MSATIERPAPRSAGVGAWLTLGQASALLGTYGRKVKALASAGAIRTLALPGAHPRYALNDVQSLASAGEDSAD